MFISTDAEKTKGVNCPLTILILIFEVVKTFIYILVLSGRA